MREAINARDADAIWAILEPVIRAGETYPLPRDMDRESALAYCRATKSLSRKTAPKSSAATSCKPINEGAARMWRIAAT